MASRRRLSQPAQVEWLIRLACGFSKKGIQTGPGLRVRDQDFPLLVLLARKQEAGKIRHLLAFFGRKSIAKFGDFQGTHGRSLMDEGSWLKLSCGLRHGNVSCYGTVTFSRR